MLLLARNQEANKPRSRNRNDTPTGKNGVVAWLSGWFLDGCARRGKTGRGLAGTRDEERGRRADGGRRVDGNVGRWFAIRPRCLLAMLCMMRAASFLAHNRKQSTPRDASMLWLRLTFVGRLGRALRPDGRATMDSHGATGTACESATPTDRKLRNCCYGRQWAANVC